MACVGGLGWPSTFSVCCWVECGGGLEGRCQAAYQRGKKLGVEKIDLDKFRSPPSYQKFPSILRILCAVLCTSNTGCREGFLCAACSVNV